jgi:4'-phosphopantetheinyl transferase
MFQYRIIDNLDLSPEEIEELINSLPKWRRDEALKFKRIQGQKENAMAYDLLRKMLGSEPYFKYGSHGKPYSSNSEKCFNIAHCKNAIGVIIGDKEVGIDVECMGRYKPALAEYAMSEAELKEIEEGGDKAFTMLWTKKEALLKLTGEGIVDDLKNVLTSERMKNVKIISGYDEEKQYAWSIAYTNNDGNADVDGVL